MHQIRYAIGLKNFFIQSEVKPKPIATRLHTRHQFLLFCRQSCLNPRVETHCHSLLLHSPSPRFFMSSFLRFPSGAHVRATRGRQLLSIRSTCPIHAHLLFLTSSLMVSVLALLCTSSLDTRIGQYMRQLHVITSSFDWLTGFLVSFVIG